jgi:TonB family protein
MGVVVGSQLLLGESVRVEFLLPHTNLPVRATAVVRYQRERSFGLQFLRLPEEQQSVIRYWTRCEGELLLAAQRRAAQPAATLPAARIEEAAAEAPIFSSFGSFETSRSRFRTRKAVGLAVAVVVVAAVALVGWWRWQRGWEALKAQTAPIQEMATPALRVPAEVMQQRIRSQVTPEYPEQARRAKVQGTVVLEILVNEQGVVTQVRPVSGPAALSLAATEAVRWWRYEPYVLNGRPAAVETAVALEFRLAN